MKTYVIATTVAILAIIAIIYGIYISTGCDPNSPKITIADVILLAGCK